MAEFKKWISYLYAYNGEEKKKNVGFARVEVRKGCCRLAVGIRGACNTRQLTVGLYIRKDGLLRRIPVGSMRVQEGCGEWTEETGEDNLFGTGVKLENCGGLWLCGEGQRMIYLTSWEKGDPDVREFLPKTEVGQEKAAEEGEDPTVIQHRAIARKTPSRETQTVRSAACAQTTVPCTLEEIPQLSLWESLYRYYPKISPELQEQGIELLQIRPVDIRYLPQRLWYYGNNSFLLHGYYHYKYLVLGRIRETEGDAYILGVPGVQTERDRSAARMFGFRHFLPLQGQEGYWITQITL